LFAPFIPHITEELYSIIFSDRFNELGSIHKRGSWPKAENYLEEDYIKEEKLREIGDLALEIIANIRKFKSDNSLSVKASIKQFSIHTEINIDAILEDLKNVCNSEKIIIDSAKNN